MKSNSEMQFSDDLSSGWLWKTALFSFYKEMLACDFSESRELFGK